MMAAAFLDFLGWEQLTVAEQAVALGHGTVGRAHLLATRRARSCGPPGLDREP